MNTDKITIIRKYIQFVGKEKFRPFLNEFLHKEKIERPDFDKYFSSVTKLEEEIWIYFFTKTIEDLEGSEEYPEYPVRDKILAFYYTFFQNIDEYKDYFSFCFSENKYSLQAPFSINKFKSEFRKYSKTLMTEAEQTGEFTNRLFFENINLNGFWLNFIAVFRYWLKDKSPSNEKTDVFIEKTVHFTSDLVTPGPLDSAFSLGKFLFKNISLNNK